MKIKSTKILAAILILILAVQAPLSAFAFTGKSMFTSSTYTHQDRFKDETIYQGIDVSKHNGDIDWKKLKKEGVDFVIIRVGYRGYGKTGSVNKDPRFDEYMTDALKQGFKVGVYFYSQALTKKEAKEEAKFAVKYAKKYSFQLPIFYDYEFAGVSSGRLDSAWRSKKLNKKKMTANALSFCNTIKKNGYKSMVYASKSFLEVQLDNAALTDAGYDAWLAHYYTKTGYAGRFSIWQYSAKGKVKGIDGYVDSNFMYGAMWNNYFKAKTVERVNYTGEARTPAVTVTYKDKKLTEGVDYSVKYKNNKNVGTASVIVYGEGKYESEETQNLTFNIVPKKVTGLAAKSSTTSSITYGWDKVDTADSYKVQIWRGGKWNTLGTTTSTKYTAKNLSPATNYNFRVEAVKVIGNNGYHSGYCSEARGTTQVAKVSGLTADTTVNSVKFRWTAQSNATGYKIYRYDYGKDRYYLYKTIKSGENNTVSFTKLSLNKKVRIKVLAYKAVSGRTYNGPLSDGLTAKAVAEPPALKSVSASGTRKIKAKWSKVSGVSGYQVKWSTTPKLTSNTKDQNFSKSSTTSGTVKTARSKTKYYVKVRSYVTKNGKKYYSSWSNIKSVKTK